MAIATTASGPRPGAPRTLPLPALSTGAGSFSIDKPRLISRGLAWCPYPGNRMRQRATGDLRANS